MLFRGTALLIASSLLSVASGGNMLQIHGSGTTNPSKCYWLIMQQIMDRSKLPVRLTYRAVGSSTGQYEFLGVNNTGAFKFVPQNDFGSGDIPISSGDYTSITTFAGKGIVHLPFVLGAISMFHSIPGVGDGELNMNSCLLAKIFKREIKYWNDEEILEINPNLGAILPADYPIKVARRVEGSSSTASITQYLYESCGSEWTKSMVGKKIDWQPDTMECQGSGGMTNCIRDNPGTIGYIDAGHGHEEGLIEIELKNADGNYLTSKKAAELGGIGDAAASIPSSADLDFGGVDLLNKPGANTWPIVAMSYVYVRKDLSHIDSDQEKTLLKFFLESLYDPDTIGQCEEQFGFVRVPDNVKQIALNGLEMIDTGAGEPWIEEVDTLKGTGQGPWVISKKRRTFAEYSIGLNEGSLGTAQDDIVQMKSAAATFQGNDAKQAQQIQAALIMSAVSIVLWTLLVGFFIARKVFGL